MFDNDVALITQPGAVIIPFRIDVASGTPIVVEGSRWLSVADTGAGIITVTLSPASARKPIVVLTPTDAASGVGVMAITRSVAAGSFIIELVDEGGALEDDHDVSGIIIAFRNVDEK